MNESKLKQLAAEAVRLDRQIIRQQNRLKHLKTQLVTEARARLAFGEKTAAIQGVRIHFPSPSLRSKIDLEDKIFDQIKSATNGCFDALFMPVMAYTPIEDFRTEALALLGPRATKLIKLCETQSPPRVCFSSERA